MTIEGNNNASAAAATGGESAGGEAGASSSGEAGGTDGASAGDAAGGDSSDPDRGRAAPGAEGGEAGKVKKPSLGARSRSAMDKAKERLAKAGGATTPGSKEQGGGQATGNGASTQQKPGSQATAGDQTASADPAEGGAGSTLEAPANWPADRRETFSKLPKEARDLTLAFNKEMQAGYTQATTKLAQQTKGHETLAGTMREIGMSPEQAVETLQLAKGFRDDPKGTLQKLAKQAKVEVFFERPLPAGEAPKFDSPQEMADWVAKQTQEQLDRNAQTRDAANTQKAAVKAAEDDIRTQFTDLAKNNKDFEQHRAAVVDRMASMVEHPTAQDAYDLILTLPRLKAAAVQGAKDKAALAVANKELETIRKKLTGTPRVSTQRGTAARKPGETRASSAMERAQKRIAARSTRS